ncbi:MAG TPA: Npt1/Npt2 family nucleotide transporter, partial [Longimicrobiales bacterium]|nr:Npt1/Npt2 family nucleotide transporter [Longimicrobiales bacterium]
FYGWYDLFAAALVTQFFMATQLAFNARDAKGAYPVVIAGGSIGATVGAAVTGFFAQRVGTPNLMLVAAGFMAAFAAGLPLVWPREEGLAGAGRPGPSRGRSRLSEIRELAAQPHVALIAAMVLLTVLAKQIVDYEFNAITKEVFETRDAVSAFQGKFEAATQWLPVVVLAGLRPALRRWGVGVAIFLLPAFLLFALSGLAVVGGLWVAAGARLGERSIRYSAERAGREILYVPVPPEIKLRAKAYIDMAVEKGLGKGLSGVLLLGLAAVGGTGYAAWVGVALVGVWLVAAAAIRREYLTTLSASIQGRFASLRGVFVSLFDASTLPVIEEALRSDEEVQVAFALDLIEEAEPREIERLHDELELLLGHRSEEIRRRTLDLVARWPEAVEEEALRRRLGDPSAEVREAAVRALLAAHPVPRARVVSELLRDPAGEVRRAALSVLIGNRELVPGVTSLVREHVDRLGPGAARGDRETREELALAGGLLEDRDRAEGILEDLIDDEERAVREAALRSAGHVGGPRLRSSLFRALGRSDNREVARRSLARQGAEALDFLVAGLHDEGADPAARRQIPSVLAAIGTREAAEALAERLAVPPADEDLELR